MSEAIASPPARPKSVTGLAAICTASVADLLGGYVASMWLGEDDAQGLFGHRFFLGPPILLLLGILVLGVVGIAVVVRRSRETPGVVIRLGRYVLLTFVWLIVLSVLVVAGIIEFDPFGHWRLSLAALSLPFLVLSVIISIPLLRLVLMLLGAAGVRRWWKE